MNLKRTLTGIAAASMVLGTFAPAAFAATTYPMYNTWAQKSVVYNGSTLAKPYTFVANGTTYFPIYYLEQMLKQLNSNASMTWDGTNLSINFPGANPQAASMVPGNGKIYVNGVLVQQFSKIVTYDKGAKGKVATTYAPLYPVQQLLPQLGFNDQWSLSGFSITQSTTPTGAPSLSGITVSGGNNGTGSASSPAVSLNNTAVSMSTMLTDASGNALPNTAVTFNVSNYGNYPSTLPTVENGSGTVISGTAQSNAEQYTAYTNSNGVATISISNPGGQTNAYEVVATAPYSNSTGSAVSTSPAYVEFVSNNTAGITPYATLSNPFKGTIGSTLPVTVTLPPNSAGQPQANVLVTLTVNGNAQFTNSSGQILGNTVQVVTNSSGIAQANLIDANGETVMVTASNLPTGVNAPSATYISFAQAGVPTQIGNLSVSTNTPNIGTNVVVSGQLQDAAGNPVSGGQILVTSPNNQSNDLAYVSGTSSTTFPLINGVVTGTPATSAYGDVVTADTAGNFSFSLTDPKTDTNIPFYIYPVVNGQVSSATALNTSSTTNYELTFGNSTTLSTLSIGAFDSYVQNNSATTLTGMSAQANGGGSIAGSLTNNQVSTVYVEPQNSAGTAVTGTPFTYTVSADNGGLIYSVNGTSLTNPAAAVTVTYNGSNSFNVNGQPIASMASPALASDFSIGVANSNTGTTKLTVQSGSVSSTATITFTGSSAAQIANVAPGAATVSAGGQQQVSFQVQDANGNPVPDTATTITTDASANDPFWITAVNGVTLTGNLNMGTSSNSSYTSEPTPIPLGATPSTANYSVSVPGVASWTNGMNTFNVYTDGSGNVTLTVQAGGVIYPTEYTSTTPANPNNTAPLASGNGIIGLYTDTSGNTSTPAYVYTTTGSTLSGVYTSSPFGNTSNTEGTLQGQIAW